MYINLTFNCAKKLQLHHPTHKQLEQHHHRTIHPWASKMFEGTFYTELFVTLEETVVSTGCWGGIVITVRATCLPCFVIFTCKQPLRQRNRSMTGQPGLGGISLLPPKLYCSDKCCQYIDWLSKSWKTAFSYTSQPCHTQSLYSTFNSLASSPAPHTLANFCYWGRKHPL